MANNVFANGREISCKKADGKSICAFPDVCFTPPQTPATPPGVPIPYPNTAFAKDTTKGSKTVKISGNEVMLKNQSHFKKSTGDEAGNAPKKGVVTSKITGKVYFTSWSPDVKFEGKNVVRHLDLTTHNHGSDPGNAPPWPYTDEQIMVIEEACQNEISNLETSCKGQTVDNCTDKCKKAQKCLLPPKSADKDWCCKNGNTGHHMIEDHWTKGNPNFTWNGNTSGSNAFYQNAPTVCVDGGRYEKEHGEMHGVQALREESFLTGGENQGKVWDYDAGKSTAIMAHDMTFQDSNCCQQCLEAQLDAFYGEDGKRELNKPKRQSLAKNDPTNDGRLLRGEAESILKGKLGYG
ncbi:MAG: DUF4150 domain-containing protein [Thioploca sp.]|nr:DUF4150 domain-containing protein [Thioploca sp.]